MTKCNTEKVYELAVETGKWTININGQIHNRHGRLLGYIDSRGYLTTGIRDEERITYHSSIHRLVFRHFSKKPITNGLVINHIDGNKLNNSFDNLELVTHAENLRHAVIKGLNDLKAASEKGASVSRKFSEDEIREIRNSKQTQKYFVLKYGVSKSTISYIRNRKTYDWVV